MEVDSSAPAASSLADDLFGGDPPAGDLPPAQDAGAGDDDEDDDDAGGLFGDDSDDEKMEVEGATEDVPQEAEGYASEEDDGLTAEDRAERRRLEYDEDDEDPSAYQTENLVESQSIAQIELANFGMPKGNKIWQARLPNFLGLKSEAFDELMWEPEEEAESQSEEVAKASVPDEYVIRWRWTKDADGNPVKESNSRVVRWSDGSLSLQIGSELFDVSTSIDHSAVLHTPDSSKPLPPTSLELKPTPLSDFDPHLSHGLTYLTVDHLYSQLLEAQASVYGTMTFRPTTLQSATHRRLAANVAQRYQKKISTVLADMDAEDPEKKKADREKADAEKAKRAKAQSRRSGGQRGFKHKRRETRYESGDDDGGEEGSEGEDEGYDSRRSQPKRGPGGPLAGGKDDEYDDADGFVVDSDGNEDEHVEPDYSEDEMDEIEQRAEREEQKRKEARQKREKSPDAPAVAPRRRLVVESDEDDE